MNTIGPTIPSGYSGSQVSSPSNTMGKDAFLELLVTQLANQDPLNPQDSQAFAAQLADFSSLEQLTQINTNLENSLQAEYNVASALQSSMAASLIGRTVVAVENRTTLVDGETVLRWEAADPPTHLRVEIYGTLGQLITTREVEIAEDARWTWDGKDANGNLLPDAEYQVRFLAEDAAGASINVRSLLQGTVDTVRYRDGETWLVVNGLEVDLGSVSEIRSNDSSDEDGNEGVAFDLPSNDNLNW